jgi:hypothetical protein
MTWIRGTGELFAKGEHTNHAKPSSIKVRRANWHLLRSTDSGEKTCLESICQRFSVKMSTNTKRSAEENMRYWFKCSQCDGSVLKG